MNQSQQRPRIEGSAHLPHASQSQQSPRIGGSTHSLQANQSQSRLAARDYHAISNYPNTPTYHILTISTSKTSTMNIQYYFANLSNLSILLRKPFNIIAQTFQYYCTNLSILLHKPFNFIAQTFQYYCTNR